MNRAIALAVMVAAVAGVPLACQNGANADPHEQTTTYTSLGDGIAVERTEIELVVPADNTLPWAFVEGKIENPVDGYPVIIQIHGNGGEAARFAQVSVDNDGAYEYRMRVLSIDDGVTVRAFDGIYDVTVFKVVHVGDTLGA